MFFRARALPARRPMRPTSSRATAPAAPLTSRHFDRTVTRTDVPSSSDARVYEHIVAQIERAIYEGRLAHGDKLPPERQLVREFGPAAWPCARRCARSSIAASSRCGRAPPAATSSASWTPRRRARLVDALPLGRVSLAQVAEARALLEPESARLAAARAPIRAQATRRVPGDAHRGRSHVGATAGAGRRVPPPGGGGRAQSRTCSGDARAHRARSQAVGQSVDLTSEDDAPSSPRIS